jgi:hypothetical protein
VRNAELTEFQDRLRGAAFEKADAILSLLSRTSHPVQVEAAPSDPHIGVEHESYCHLQHGLGGKCNCTSRPPVQVEVSDDMVRRADAAYWKSANDCDDHADPMRDALVAALGGGE